MLLKKERGIMPPLNNPFNPGDFVIWSQDAPHEWHFIWTPGPMIVVSSRWDDGSPTEFSQKFGGIPREPGWIITVSYNADLTLYYDPPLSIFFGTKEFKKEIHQKWLISLQIKLQPPD